MKKFSVAIILDNNAFTKEYDELTAFDIYETLTSCGEVAIISDESGFFQTNCTELPEYERVYDDAADVMLDAVLELCELKLRRAELCRELGKLRELKLRCAELYRELDR